MSDVKSFPGDWIKIQKEGITMSQSFHNFFIDMKVKIHFDEAHGLIGLEPALEGYKYSIRNGIRSRRIPSTFLRIRMKAEWSDKHGMVIGKIDERI